MAANRRKILVPLATLTVAGAVAVGSGATFTWSRMPPTLIGPMHSPASSRSRLRKKPRSGSSAR